jgi:hypothetical protein
MVEKQFFEIELECIDLPLVPVGSGELRLGVQAGKDVRQDVVLAAGQVIFRFPLAVAVDPRDGALRFSGDFAHGPRGGQFIYLCWGERVGGEWQGLRRAKLPLYTLAPEMVAAALRAGQALRARVHMTDAKGQPAAGSLKPVAYEWMT